MFPRPPQSTPASIKSGPESPQENQDSLGEEFKKLESELAKLLTTLDEKIAYIGQAEHPRFPKAEWMDFVKQLHATEGAKESINKERRMFVVGGLAAGAVMLGFGTILGASLRQLTERMEANKEERDFVPVGIETKEIPVGLFLGFLAYKIVNNGLLQMYNLEERENQVDIVIGEARYKRMDLIKYALSNFNNDQGKAEKFVDDFLRIVSRMSKVKSDLEKLENKK